MKNNSIQVNQVLVRFFLYFLIAFFYISFMSLYAPLGTNWLEWHFQRIYNFSEYLRINGYFTNFGFSIWSKCTECSLNADDWKDKIYLSINFFTIFPYVIINDLFGSNNLRFYGNLLDKMIITFTGCLIAELYLKFLKTNSNLYKLSIAISIFLFFLINPWTYKMLISAWWIIYFIIFFLFGIFMILENREKLGLLSLFIAGCFDYQSSAGIVMFYILLKIFTYFKNKNFNIQEYFPSKKNDSINYKIMIILALPVIIFLLLRFLVATDLETNSGSSLLSRIGISGDDIHNGGVLGALQFLGGNRITKCLANFSGNLSSMPLDTKIEIFNCILSILGMFLLSAISIIGLLYLQRNEKKYFNIMILPLAFLLLSYSFLLQQSSSVHLMGYSYFFSVLFSVGITSLIFNVLKKYSFSITSIILATPITLGVIILCIRVNMLTGING